MAKLLRNKDKIGGFTNNFYWSSTEGDTPDVFSVWRQNFRNGNQNEYNVDMAQGCIRAVRVL